MKRALALGLLVAACSRAGDPAPAPYALEPAVARRIAELEAELARAPAPAPPADPLPLGEVRDLLGALAGSEGRLHAAALADFQSLGDRAVPALREELVASDDDPALRAAAAEALGAIATPAAVDALLERLERARREADPEPWMRAQCAWRLPLAQADWARDRLLLDLKYEVDYETVIWLARTLESVGSLAGVVGLDAIARGDQPERAAEAAAVLDAWADARGLADRADLVASYHAGRFVADEERKPLSPRAELTIWTRIRALAEWQLREVDDARFVLLRWGPTAVDALARALHDENRYVRLHSAQVLERMGARARAAADALVDALREDELAPQAARALGALGEPRARPALAAALAGSRRYDLRVAAARALAVLGADGVDASLVPLCAAGTPPDLRVAAASALLSVRAFPDGGEALAIVAAALAARPSEAPPLEALVERWLARGGDAALEAAARWSALAADPERAAKRAALLQELAPPK